MKFRFYADLFTGNDPTHHGLFALTKPGSKPEGSKRVAFDVEIPDSIVFGVDYVALDPKFIGGIQNEPEDDL